MTLSDTTPRIEYQELDEAVQELDEKDKEVLVKDLHGSDEKGIEERVALRVVHRVASLVDLKAELDSMDPNETQIYRRALQKCPMYVTCESFLLSFLRAEEFHAGNAARRLVVYWKEKYDLFGEEYTFGPITLDSLQDADLRVIENGGFTILPKDEHGRLVLHRDRSATMVNLNGPEAVVCDMNCFSNKPINSIFTAHTDYNTFINFKLRAFMYLVHDAIADDDDVQRKGMVILSASRFEFKMEDHDRNSLQRFFQLLSCLPIRTASYHIVGDFMTKDFTARVMPSIHWLMGSHMSIRHRVHNGVTHQEVHASLAEYGITKLPTFLGGDVECNGVVWLQEKQRKHKAMTDLKHRYESLPRSSNHTGDKDGLSNSIDLDSILTFML
jgi:hypothetical protein